MKPNPSWWSCDGKGHVKATAALSEISVSRRAIVVGAGLIGLNWMLQPSALAQVSISKRAKGNGNATVVVFMRGGADGLSLIPPYFEDAYYRNRPTLAFERPGKGANSVLKLDDQFGLNPNASALFPLFESGQMAVIHAVGSGDETRSHFEAMNTMERGAVRPGEGAPNGWIARFLNATADSNTSPLRALSLTSTLPDSLRGATGALAIQDVEQLKLGGSNEFQAGLRELYGTGSDELHAAGSDSLETLSTLQNLDFKEYKSAGKTEYPESPLGLALKQTAFLLKSGVGLEIACVDAGGWDTHVAQGLIQGNLANLVSDLANSLRAFWDDIDSLKGNVRMIAQTEFGRRVEENQGFGTDHGRSSILFAIGGGINGGKVYANWPGLEKKNLDENGDLKVTTDYRIPVSEVLSLHSQGKYKWQAQTLGLVTQR